MKHAAYLAALSATALVTGACKDNLQLVDASLCENDSALLVPNFVMHGVKDDAGRFYFEIALHQIPRVATYTYIASMNPPLEGIELPAVFAVGAEPKRIRTVTSDQPAVQMGELLRSTAWLDAGAGDQVFTRPVVGRYPVLGSSRVVQTPERLTTHANPGGVEQSIDIAARRGSAVVAFKAGVVSDVEHRYHDNNSCGSAHAARHTNHLRILQDDGFEAIYAHLERDSILVEEGQRVEAGQLLAGVGCYDVCTNSHLHLQVGAIGNDGYHSVPVLFYADDPDSAWKPRLLETRELQE